VIDRLVAQELEQVQTNSIRETAHG